MADELVDRILGRERPGGAESSEHPASSGRTARSIDLDLAMSHETGGSTSAMNGEGLCEACNYAKAAPRWRARPGPGGP